MAIVNRQNNLFAAEDWKVAYKAYSQVDFQAYDFDSIKTSLVNYIKTNFPENFNDYIESSEFIAIIELLSFLSQSIAFRMDINTRENFLETAERRDSVFKLARMLGYNPKRNVAASGLMKLVSVKTSEPLTDSQNNSLNNSTVFWDDANNPDSYEQFITILNAGMSSTNRFTAPIKTGSVSGVPTEMYQINTTIGSPIAYSFTINSNGTSRPFEIVNGNFSDNGYFYEVSPDPLAPFNFFYRNDGLGLASDNTGFFLMFKQGTLQFQDFNFTSPTENRIQDIAVNGINETDVFVQEVSTGGTVLNQWAKIPNTVGQTLNYNSKSLNTRNLYAIENLNNDGVRLKFPDGNFGNIPTGIYRTWYRTSAGDRYSIQPDDARNLSISVPYTNGAGDDYLITLGFELKSSVNNSLPAESIENIKARAPQTFYTQNRMVSAQDYNVFPLSQSSNILKLRATNKTHAGHSRYIDINDPTGTFQSVKTYTEDGVIAQKDAFLNKSLIVNENNSASTVVRNILPTYFKEQNLNNFMYNKVRQTYQAIRPAVLNTTGLVISWKPLPVKAKNKTGYMLQTVYDTDGSGAIDRSDVVVNNNPSFSGLQVFQENNFVKFVNPDIPSEYKWVRIIDVQNNGALASGLSTSVGPWSLSADVNEDWRAYEVITTLRKTFTPSEETALVSQINDKKSFGLGFNIETNEFYIITNSNLPALDRDTDNTTTSTYGIQNIGNTEDNSWLLKFDYTPIDNTSWRYNITIRGIEYIAESKNNLRFYNVNSVKVTDSTTKATRDKIVLNTLNYKPSNDEEFWWSDKPNVVTKVADGIGDSWQSQENNAFYEPNGVNPMIPIKSRDARWSDIRIKWQSNFGILSDDISNPGDLASIISKDRFVDEAIVELNTFFDDPQGNALTPNVTISNFSGAVSKLPINFQIEFSNTTFGTNILTGSEGNITYKQLNPDTNIIEIYHGNNLQVGGNVYSYGATGAVYNASAIGSVLLVDANATAGTGTIQYNDLDDNNHLYASDSVGVSRDKITVSYLNSREKLENNIEWDIIGPYQYEDGYTDPSKVKIAPVDTDGDLVPDRPQQYDEFVGQNDLVIYEKVTDFDGYEYDRPVTGGIVDYRSETTLDTTQSETLSAGSFANPIDIDSINWVIVDTLSVAELLENVIGKYKDILVYVVGENNVYKCAESTTTPGTISLLLSNKDYFVRNGRAETQNTLETNPVPVVMKWDHRAPNDVRIDPSISNVVEMLVLTNNYYSQILKYINVTGTEFPLAPTNEELSNEFLSLDQFKSASDVIVYKSAEFKRLFGTDADTSLQAKFRIVKIPGSSLSDNEIKSRVIQTFNQYFNINNWEFGETFYFTELASYVHQQLGNTIGSIVILPKNTAGSFGDLFQVKSEPYELFLSTATVNDIEIVEKISSQTLRADK